MKSIVLLLSVSACAYGAPSRFMERDSLVPEVAMVQTQDQMDALKAEFEQVKSLAASGKTAGIGATIDKMINMIEGEDGLETMIKDAHATDQTTLNTDMAAIGTHNSAFVTEEAALQQDGNNVRKLIDDEQAKSQTWEAQAGAFTSSQSVFLGAFTKQTNACCKRDQAAVMSVEYVPSYAECDYKIQSTSGGCAERAKNDVNDVVSSPFTEGLTRYRNARKECNDDTTALNSAESDTANQFSKCGSDKAAAVAASNLATQEQTRMQGEWDAATKKYKGTYDKLYSAYTKTEERVQKDDKDRTEEWGAMQEIKCMLNEYKKSHVFDDSTHATCAKSVVKAGVVDIGYPKVIKRIEPELKPFEAQADDSAYENTCNKRAPSPAFSCPSGIKAKPLPNCNTHKQPPAPVHKHHQGPWSGEVEAKGWRLKAGQRSPSAGGAAKSCVTKEAKEEALVESEVNHPLGHREISEVEKAVNACQVNVKEEQVCQDLDATKCIGEGPAGIEGRCKQCFDCVAKEIGTDVDGLFAEVKKLKEAPEAQEAHLVQAETEAETGTFTNEQGRVCHRRFTGCAWRYSAFGGTSASCHGGRMVRPDYQ